MKNQYESIVVTYGKDTQTWDVVCWHKNADINNNQIRPFFESSFDSGVDAYLQALKVFKNDGALKLIQLNKSGEVLSVTEQWGDLL
tara:strand:- start:14 stop:271 length:258 start_codon:yes stop_codon:yes gene_type:complete